MIVLVYFGSLYWKLWQILCYRDFILDPVTMHRIDESHKHWACAPILDTHRTHWSLIDFNRVCLGVMTPKYKKKTHMFLQLLLSFTWKLKTEQQFSSIVSNLFFISFRLFFFYRFNSFVYHSIKIAIVLWECILVGIRMYNYSYFLKKSIDSSTAFVNIVPSIDWHWFIYYYLFVDLHSMPISNPFQ